jgi:hypothetical protein
MKHPKDNDLTERRKASVQAKAALLDAHRAAKAAAEPTRVARREERAAVASARNERRAARDQARHETEARAQAEAARQEAAADDLAKEGAGDLEEAQTDHRPHVVEDEADRKAKRDLRYANRKARQR